MYCVMYDGSISFFEVSCGQIRVSDPCYENDSDGGLTINNVLNGSWLACSDCVENYDCNISRVYAVHCDYNNKVDYCDLKKVGSIGVDSGQAGIFDKVYYNDNQGGKYDDVTSFYGKCCEITLENNCGVVDGYGVVSSSGYGDGCYDVSVCEMDGKVVCVLVEFICDEECEKEY